MRSSTRRHEPRFTSHFGVFWLRYFLFGVVDCVHYNPHHDPRSLFEALDYRLSIVRRELLPIETAGDFPCRVFLPYPIVSVGILRMGSGAGYGGRNIRG